MDRQSENVDHRRKLSISNRIALLAAILPAIGAIIAATITIAPNLLKIASPPRSDRSLATAGTPSTWAVRHRPRTKKGSSQSPSGVPAGQGGGDAGQSRTTPIDTSAPTPVVQHPSSPPARTYSETTGGVTHTWTDYTDAGGTEGLEIRSVTTISITCRVQGLAVQDGNTWWYRIASSPWGGRFYASADAFYNNGRRSGSLINTPYFDASVPICP